MLNVPHSVKMFQEVKRIIDFGSIHLYRSIDLKKKIKIFPKIMLHKI